MWCWKTLWKYVTVFDSFVHVPAPVNLMLHFHDQKELFKFITLFFLLLLDNSL